MVGGGDRYYIMEMKNECDFINKYIFFHLFTDQIF